MANASAHSSIRGRIAGTGDSAVVGDRTQRLALVVLTGYSLKSTRRAPKTCEIYRMSHDTRGTLEWILGVLAAAFSRDSFLRRRRIRVFGGSSRVGREARAPDCAVRESGEVGVLDCELENR